MSEIIENNNEIAHESDVQVIPPEFYGGIKRALPKPVVREQAPLVSQARKAPSPASTASIKSGAVLPSGSIIMGKISLKAVAFIGGGVFIVVIAVVTYYYISQAQKLQQQSAQNSQVSLPAIAPSTEIPQIATSTPIVEIATSTPQTPALQPLVGAVFPQKTFTETLDSDHDGITDNEEFLYGTDQQKPDSDGDGYLDGLEVVNLYNPLGFKPVRLIDSGKISTYVNSTFGYSIYYPSIWNAQSLDNTNSQVIFSSGDGDYVEVMKIENPLKLSPVDWYKGQSPGTEISDLKPIVNKDKVEGILSPDGLTAYLPFGDALYVIAYNIGIKDQISYLQTFKMMVASFRYPGVMEQAIESAGAGISANQSGNSVTSTPFEAP